MTDQPGLFDLPVSPPQPTVPRRTGRGRDRETFARHVVVDVVVADRRALREEALHRFDTAPTIDLGEYDDGGEDLLDPREEIAADPAGALRWCLEPTEGLWPLLDTIRIDEIAHDAVDDGAGRVRVSWTVIVGVTDAAALRELALSGCRSDDVVARDEIDASFAAAWNRAADPFAPLAGIPGITWTPACVEVEQVLRGRR